MSLREFGEGIVDAIPGYLQQRQRKQEVDFNHLLQLHAQRMEEQRLKGEQGDRKIGLARQASNDAFTRSNVLHDNAIQDATLKRGLVNDKTPPQRLPAQKPWEAAGFDGPTGEADYLAFQRRAHPEQFDGGRGGGGGTTKPEPGSPEHMEAWLQTQMGRIPLNKRGPGGITVPLNEADRTAAINELKARYHTLYPSNFADVRGGSSTVAGSPVRTAAPTGARPGTVSHPPAGTPPPTHELKAIRWEEIRAAHPRLSDAEVTAQVNQEMP